MLQAVTGTNQPSPSDEEYGAGISDEKEFDLEHSRGFKDEFPPDHVLFEMEPE